jgi:hypothetical protein
MFIVPFMHAWANSISFRPKIGTDVLQRSLPLDGAIRPSSTVKADTYSQGTSCKQIFSHGSLLPILPSIIITRAKLNMRELQHGLFKAENSENGRRMVLCCGFVVIVRLSRLFCRYRTLNPSPKSQLVRVKASSGTQSSSLFVI